MTDREYAREATDDGLLFTLAMTRCDKGCKERGAHSWICEATGAYKTHLIYLKEAMRRGLKIKELL